MNITDIPNDVNDLKDILSEEGFSHGHVWYHGTTSALVNDIKRDGLNGGGDEALMTKIQGTLNTIGAQAATSNQPVFLTPSKALAYYWAREKTNSRNVYFSNDEQPAVFEVNLNEDENKQVKPDAGGAALLLEPNNAYIEFIKQVYQQQSIDFPDVHPLQVPRMAFITQFGLAYSDANIKPSALTVLS